MKTIQLITLLLLTVVSVNAQKEISAIIIDEKMKIDGELTESIWERSLEDGNFKQLSPNNGQPHTHKTKIAIGYDEAYFYVGAELLTTSINKNLTSRDDLGTSDYFGMIIDLFGENREAWAFIVTPANVQADIKVTNAGSYYEWNAVWESAVAIHEDKWTVEFKIPFNSLRFSKDDFSNIKINFERREASTNEDSFWNFIDANVDGLLNQFGKLKGIKNINSPLNLSFSPFVSVINEKNAEANSKTTFNGGLDVKYVYNNAYTLDVSLVPDFSQALSDDQVYNLSPFEIKYDENRQFFVEGTELFDKGGYLYTRRIGGTPINKDNFETDVDESVVSNPISSNILNLVKFTGKSKNGLSIGVLNGITAKSEAEIKNESTEETRTILTNPLTNYNAIVVDKALENNSSVTLINNSVLRNGADYDANFTALLYRWYNKERTYSAYFKKALYQKYISGEENIFGHQYYAYLAKVSGKFKGGLTFNSLDDEFDNNDFGFLSRNNQLEVNGEVSYTENQPKKIFSSYTFYGNYVSSYYQSLLEKEDRYYQLGTYGTFKKNNHTFFADFTYYEKGKDFYEARTEDRFFNTVGKTQAFLEYQTNSSKRVSFAGYAQFTSYLNSDIQTYNLLLGHGIRSRIGQHLYVYLSQYYQKIPNSLGYLTSIEDDILFGKRDYKILNNELLLNYAINSKINIATTFRHYWAQVDYSKEYELATDGNLTNTDVIVSLSDYNNNYNSFSIDFLTAWQFAPASEISLGYKLGTTYDNSAVSSTYLGNLKSTLKEEGNHTVSLKVTYFIDYNTLKNKRLF